MSAWGKSVKALALFKEEFEKFMRIERVREALAADLGVETPLASRRKLKPSPRVATVTPERLERRVSSIPRLAVPSDTPRARVVAARRGGVER